MHLFSLSKSDVPLRTDKLSAECSEPPTTTVCNPFPYHTGLGSRSCNCLVLVGACCHLPWIYYTTGQDTTGGYCGCDCSDSGSVCCIWCATLWSIEVRHSHPHGPASTEYCIPFMVIVLSVSWPCSHVVEVLFMSTEYCANLLQVFPLQCSVLRAEDTVVWLNLLNSPWVTLIRWSKIVVYIFM